MMEHYLNKKRYSECSGACCKRNGCMYLPEDFISLEYDYLLNLINIGNISVKVALFNVWVTETLYKKYNLQKRYSNNGILWSFYLYLQARNVDSDIIDFFGSEKTCSMLNNNGCKYNDDERPALGLSLIPGKRQYDECKQPAYKYLYEIMYDWIKYQNVLEEIVRKFTGKTSFDLLIEESTTHYSYWSIYCKNKQNYIDPKLGIKIECD